jgi:tetratricopeptide (TPR) repeat protein
LQNEIRTIEEQNKTIVKNTYWPLIKQAQAASALTKISSLQIALRLSCIAECYASDSDQDLAISHWRKAIVNLQKYCCYPIANSEINYRNWFDLANIYAQLIQYQIKNERSVSSEDLENALVAVNRALKFKDSYEGVFRKYFFLQLMEDLGIATEENAIDWLKKLLDVHPDKTSEEYINYGQLYGGELAKRQKFEEATNWLRDLLLVKEDPITYLYLGKVYNNINEHQSAVTEFENATQLSPESLEIKIWLLSERVKLMIEQFHHMDPIAPQAVDEWVSLCNEFCSFFSNAELYIGTTSTFIPLQELTEHIYLTLLPEMANTLTRLQQFSFATFLYESMFANLELYLNKGMFDNLKAATLYTTLGGLYLKNRELEKAENSLRKAIEICPNYLIAYENLVAVLSSQKDNEKLESLWATVEPLIESFREEFKDAEVSTLLFNFGTASLSGTDPKSAFDKAKIFYQHSFDLNPNNWDTRLHLSRVLALSEEKEEAEKLLTNFNEAEKDFEIPLESKTRFQIYFCLAALRSLLSNSKDAKLAAIEAGKTKYNPTKVELLNSYLENIKAEPEKVQAELLEAIRKIGFQFRIGAIINPKSIKIRQGEFIGYHGTSDVYLDRFKEGIQPSEAKVRQMNGKGFYIAQDKTVASYFAMKTVKSLKQGNPVLLKIFASKDIVGQQLACKSMKKDTSTQYDFIINSIDGLEKFEQIYVPEKNIPGLENPTQFDPVEWKEEDFKKFQRYWGQQPS